MSRLWSGFALLGSTATLLCCVIPALLVALGFGASLASLFTSLPQLTLLSEYKGLIFLCAGLLIGGAYWMRTRPAAQVCPTDPQLARACMKSRRVSAVLFWSALGLYLAAGFFVFLLPAIL